MKHLSFQFVFKIYLSSLKLFIDFGQDACAFKLRQIHVYNCSPVFNYLFALGKPFINFHITEMIKLHAPGSNTILKYVPHDVLPTEFGGSAGPFSEVKKLWDKKCAELR
jgi:hypothetical protein